MNVARAVAQRSDCNRAQYGAVIVSPAQRLVATGFNGAPARSPDSCDTCPRYLRGPDGAHRDECIAVHAEANALLFADRRDVEYGTMYCTGATCWGCARLIANSGIARVVMTSDGGSHRGIDEVIPYLASFEIKVEVWKD
jgi:dCMP deaminase